MSGRVSKGRASPKFVKDILQFVRSSDDDSNADRPQVEKQAEVVQIPVVEGIFVVPLDLKSDTVFEAINLVRRLVNALAIHFNGSLKLLFNPTALCQESVDESRQFAFVAPTF